MAGAAFSVRAIDMTAFDFTKTARIPRMRAARLEG
jgi:hypothetical protein